MSRRGLQVTINGRVQTLGPPRRTGSHWQAYNINPAALQPGVKDFLVSGAGGRVSRRLASPKRAQHGRRPEPECPFFGKCRVAQRASPFPGLPYFFSGSRIALPLFTDILAASSTSCTWTLMSSVVIPFNGCLVRSRFTR